MITKIVSHQIKGQGKGKNIGFPTINLEINPDLVLPIGVYGVWVIINEKKYLGALHFGPIPTFHNDNKSLEVHLIDVKDLNLPTELPYPVIVEVIGRIRDVLKFGSTEDLVNQIKKDLAVIRKISSR